MASAVSMPKSFFIASLLVRILAIAAPEAPPVVHLAAVPGPPLVEPGHLRGPHVLRIVELHAEIPAALIAEVAVLLHDDGIPVQRLDDLAGREVQEGRIPV